MWSNGREFLTDARRLMAAGSRFVGDAAEPQAKKEYRDVPEGGSRAIS
jgi:hypothetical protein